MQLVSEHACFGGVQQFFKHDSRETGGPMKLSVFQPPQAKSRRVPALFFLSGLTCTEETFPTKAHAQAVAAQLGLALIAPDTSPRQPRLAGDADSWDFGQGAGFYVDATEAPWSANYRMYSYVTEELRALSTADLPVMDDAIGIFGHSMGGHGALTIALRNPERFKSASAFAPIGAPMQCPWGQKAFGRYLGSDRSAWRNYDSSELVARKAHPAHMLVDQGTADQFLTDRQLLPEVFAAAAAKSGQKLKLRMQPGFDHSYYFIQTFMADHLHHHSKILRP
ncbi:MAG: S-formylglutathione hydrolase [Pseudomonadota bacterium]|nr:S-formylglutathione hydrolase [Pseudomonadota bacterium]